MQQYSYGAFIFKNYLNAYSFLLYYKLGMYYVYLLIYIERIRFIPLAFVKMPRRVCFFSDPSESDVEGVALQMPRDSLETNILV